MSSSVIDINDIKKTFKTGFYRRKYVNALQGITLQVGKGEVFGLLGPNGAGKTTLIKILLGIVRKQSGEATVLGHVAGSRAARRKVGYLPEHHRIPRHFTGYSALDFYGSLSNLPRSVIRAKREELLESVGLREWGNTPVHQYSKGMQQRLGLAQAILHDPDLLILDEPTDGVDPVGRAKIRDLLDQLKKQGKTIFINSHLLQEVELICDRVAIVKQGQVQKMGAIDEITHLPETHFVFELNGDQEMITQLLSKYEILDTQSNGDQRVVMDLNLSSVEEVDHVVDLLRENSISILSLARKQMTLEQAFLNLISD
jgi:ABC-2 type transport system ATP-binding protein